MYGAPAAPRPPNGMASFPPPQQPFVNGRPPFQSHISAPSMTFPPNPSAFPRSPWTNEAAMPQTPWSPDVLRSPFQPQAPPRHPITNFVPHQQQRPGHFGGGAGSVSLGPGMGLPTLHALNGNAAPWARGPSPALQPPSKPANWAPPASPFSPIQPATPPPPAPKLQPSAPSPAPSTIAGATSPTTYLRSTYVPPNPGFPPSKTLSTAASPIPSSSASSSLGSPAKPTLSLPRSALAIPALTASAPSSPGAASNSAGLPVQPKKKKYKVKFPLEALPDEDPLRDRPETSVLLLSPGIESTTAGDGDTLLTTPKSPGQNREASLWSRRPVPLTQEALRRLELVEAASDIDAEVGSFSDAEGFEGPDDEAKDVNESGEEGKRRIARQKAGAMTRAFWPEDQGLGRHPLPDTVDIYLPGKAAWDDYKAEVMEETLRSLGIKLDREGLDFESLKHELDAYNTSHPEAPTKDHPLLSGLTLSGVPAASPPAVLPAVSPSFTAPVVHPRGHSSTMSLALPPSSGVPLHSPGFPDSPWEASSVPPTPAASEVGTQQLGLKPTAPSFVPGGGVGLKVTAQEFRPSWAVPTPKLGRSPTLPGLGEEEEEEEEEEEGAEAGKGEEGAGGEEDEDVVTDSEAEMTQHEQRIGDGESVSDPDATQVEDARPSLAAQDVSQSEEEIVTDSDALSDADDATEAELPTTTLAGGSEEDDVPLAALSLRRAALANERPSLHDFSGYEGGSDGAASDAGTEYSNPSEEEQARLRSRRAAAPREAFNSVESGIADHWLHGRQVGEGEEEESFDRTTDADELEKFVTSELRRASSSAFRTRPLPPLPGDPASAQSSFGSHLAVPHGSPGTVGRAAGRSLNALAGEFKPSSTSTFTFSSPGPKMPSLSQVSSSDLSPLSKPPQPLGSSKRQKLESANEDGEENVAPKVPAFSGTGERPGKDNMKTFKFPPSPPRSTGTPQKTEYLPPIRVLPALPHMASNTSLRAEPQSATRVEAGRPVDDAPVLATISPISRKTSAYELIPTQPGIGGIRRIVSTNTLRNHSVEDTFGSAAPNPSRASASPSSSRPGLPKLNILPPGTRSGSATPGAAWRQSSRSPSPTPKKQLHTPYASTEYSLDGFGGASVPIARSRGADIPIMRGDGPVQQTSPSFPRSPADAHFDGETSDHRRTASSQLEPTASESDVVGRRPHKTAIEKVLERELGGLRSELKGLHSLRMEWDSITRDALVDALTSRLDSALGHWSEVFTPPTAGGNLSPQTRSEIATDIADVLLPQLETSRELDVDELTFKLSNAVKPHITALIDLASDKKETAELIVAALQPLLLEGRTPALDEEVLAQRVKAELGPILAQASNGTTDLRLAERVSADVADRLTTVFAEHQKASALATSQTLLQQVPAVLQPLLASDAAKLEPTLKTLQGSVDGLEGAFTARLASAVEQLAKVKQGDEASNTLNDLISENGRLQASLSKALTELEAISSARTQERAITEQERDRLQTEHSAALEKANAEAEAARSARQVSEVTAHSLQDAVAQTEKEAAAFKQENEELRGKVAALLAQEAAKEAKEAQMAEENGLLQTKVRVLEADSSAYKRQVELATCSYERLRQEHGDELERWRNHEDELRQQVKVLEQENRGLVQRQGTDLQDALEAKSKLEGTVATLEKRVAAQDEKITTLQRTAATKQQSLATATQRISELEKHTKDVEPLQQEVTRLSKEASRSAQLEEELRSLRERATSLEAQNQIFREERETVRGEVERMHETVRSELAEAARQSAQAVERAEVSRKEAERLQKELEELQAEHVRAVKRKEHLSPPSLLDSSSYGYPTPPQPTYTLPKAHKSRPRSSSNSSVGTVRSFNVGGVGRGASPTPSRASVVSRVSVDEDGWWS